MYEVTVIAADVSGLIDQMKVFIEAFSGVSASAATLKSGALKGATVKLLPASEPSEVDPPKKDAVVEADKKAEADAEQAEAEKALKKMRDDALVIARDVFAASKEGAAAVRKMPKAYGVKKLQDVPVAKAAELLSALKKLKAGEVANA